LKAKQKLALNAISGGVLKKNLEHCAHQRITVRSSFIMAILGTKTFYLFQLVVLFLCLFFSGTAGRVRCYSKSVNVADWLLFSSQRFICISLQSGVLQDHLYFSVSVFFQTLHITAFFDCCDLEFLKSI